MLRYRLFAVGVLLSLVAVDTASAGVLGFGRRRWERRKAQLRAELVCQLEHKMNQDMAREVEAMSAHLNATAENLVKIEAEKLEQQVQQALVQLREEAMELVASEAKRLDQELGKHMADLQRQSQAQIAAEASNMKKQLDNEIGALTAKYQEQTQALRSTVEQEIAKIPGQISQQLENGLKPKKTAAEATDTTPVEGAPEKKGDEVSASPPSALLNKEVQLAETSVDDEVSE